MKPRTTSKGQQQRLSLLSGPIACMIGVIFIMLVLGIVFSIVNFPLDNVSGPSTNSMLSQVVRVEENTKTLTKKIMNWLPSHHWIHAPKSRHHDIHDEIIQPDFRRKFWTPIDMDNSYDPIITLCQLDFEKYSNSPHLYPMFRDLETISNCHGNKRKEALSVLLAELDSNTTGNNERFLSPSGFVFHESRVGSTLVANTLASNPWNLVFSEASAPANALLHCEGCDRARAVKLFRDVVTLMGRTTFHTNMFLKFQSITATKMDIALEAFPNTSWVFLYRNPVQTIMSHLDPAKGSGSGAPCLRSMREPPYEVLSVVTEACGTKAPPKEAWCAAHLNMLCLNALRAHDKYGLYQPQQSRSVRGLLVNYESLPGVVPRLILPLFGIREISTAFLHKMDEESSFYSKGRQRVRSFNGDSADKEERATQPIQQFAKLILSSTYNQLELNSFGSISKIAPSVLTRKLLLPGSEAGTQPDHPIDQASNSFNWNVLASFPAVSRTNSSQSNLVSEEHVDSSPLASSSSSEGKDIDAVAVLEARIVSGNGGSVTVTNNAPGSTHDAPGLNQGEKSQEISATLAEHHRRHSTALHDLPFAPWAPFANTHESQPMEHVHCPDTPPPGYPKAYFMSDVVANWNPDDTNIPLRHYDALCHFDYQDARDNAKAWAYRNAEVPFVYYNVPEVDVVAKRWSNFDFLEQKLGTRKFTTEQSKDNHFMYHTESRRQHLRGSNGNSHNSPVYVPPTTVTHTSFETWLENAVKAQNKTLEDRRHEYFRVSSNLDGGNSWLFDELPFFKPKKSLFLADPNHQQGIHCRFGMRSVIAEAHFDASRNTVVMLSGMRRWMLAHPAQCSNLHLYPSDHPSARHSAIDWSKPNISAFPNFLLLQGNEVILQPGDVLYLPTYWIHYIVSLNVNIQCNSRSGSTFENVEAIRKCGFQA